jgi:hypothetical protein
MLTIEENISRNLQIHIDKLAIKSRQEKCNYINREVDRYKAMSIYDRIEEIPLLHKDQRRGVPDSYWDNIRVSLVNKFTKKLI